MAVAIPSFREMLNKNSVSSVSNDLLAGILLARSEAVKREQNVVIARLGSDWSGGWRVFVDLDGDNSFDSGTEAELVVNRLESDDGVTVSGNGNAATYVRFNPRGRAVVLSGTSNIGLDPDDDYLSISRDSCSYNVIFSPTGRPHVSESSCS